MFNYYPKFSDLLALKDKYFQDSESCTLNIYIDFKNVHKVSFMKEYIDAVYNSIINTGKLEISTFHSVINYIMRLKNFFRLSMKFQRVKFFFFIDYGTSIYHHQIYKDYKKNRLISSTSTLDPMVLDKVISNLKMNVDLCYKILNYVEDVFVIKLDHLESDFIPHYLIRNNTSKSDYHLILSNDKDMLQSLTLNDRTFMYVKNISSNKSKGNILALLNKNSVVNYFMRTFVLKDEDTQYHPEIAKHFPLLLSLCGDDGDNVPGIKNVGIKKAYSILVTLLKYNINLDDIVDCILYKKKYEFNASKNSDITSTLKTINDNLELLNVGYRLISFDQLIYFLDISSSTKPDKYSFNYPINTSIKDKYIDVIANTINNTKKFVYSFKEILQIINSIKGNIVWNSAFIQESELQNHCKLFNGF